MMKENVDIKIDQLFRSYFEKLLWYFRTKNTKLDEELLKDLIHNVFIKLYKHLLKKPEQEIRYSYLITCVTNEVNDYFKKNKLLYVPLDKDYKDEEEDIYNKELLSELEVQILLLPSQQRKICELRMNDKSYKEIAEELGIKVKTIEGHITCAFSTLRKNILEKIGQENENLSTHLLFSILW